MINCRKYVVNRDPAPVLLPAPHPPTQAEPERGQHFAERPSLGREHNAEPHIHNPYPRIPGRTQCVFPFNTEAGEETLAGAAILGQ